MAHGNIQFKARQTLEALTTLTAVFTVSLYSSALSVLWNDSKRAIHHVPKTSCREGNDEAKKKPRDTQVESPIEWPSHLQCAVASPPLLTAFRYFFYLSYLKINRLSWLICSHARWRSVLFSHQLFFSFFCFMSSLQLNVAHGLSLWLVYPWFQYYVHLIILSELCFFLTGELMFHQELLRNTLNFLRRWKAQRMALTRWLNILQYEVCWKTKQQQTSEQARCL